MATTSSNNTNKITVILSASILLFECPRATLLANPIIIVPINPTPNECTPAIYKATSPVIPDRATSAAPAKNQNHPTAKIESIGGAFLRINLLSKISFAAKQKIQTPAKAVSHDNDKLLDNANKTMADTILPVM